MDEFGLISIQFDAMRTIHSSGSCHYIWTQLLADSITIAISFTLYRRVIRKLIPTAKTA